MIGTAQKTQIAGKSPASAFSAHEQPRTRSGAGNHHRANGSGVLQTKLTIGKANDPFEQEADRVASEVMRMPLHQRTANVDQGAVGNQSVQRQCACHGTCGKCKNKQLSLKRLPTSATRATEVPGSVDHVLRSSGAPLDATTRGFMQPRFGYDFSQVRVHADAAAAQSARDLGALAFTVGNHIAFAAGQYSPGGGESNRLLAHELAHVIQQGAARSLTEGGGPNVGHVGTSSGSQVSGVIQRAGDPAAIPAGFACPTDLTAGTPAGPDLTFPERGTTVGGPTHDPQLTVFVAAWIAAGGTDDIVVHGYASTTGASSPGGEALNWTLSCERAEHVRAALIARGIPPVHITVVAHGTSTDFGAAPADNQHAVISSSPGGLFSPPIVIGRLTPLDDFAGRSHVRFGVDEFIVLDFFSIPAATAADLNGLEWHLVAGGGVLANVTQAGTADYTAPPNAAVVTLELRVATGATAGRVVDTRVITIVEPNDLDFVPVAGTSPNFGGWGAPLIAAGTWGAGFQANVFALPRDVSFWGVVFSEGNCPAVVTPAGSFLSVFGPHVGGTFGAAGRGNSATGSPLNAISPDGIWFFAPSTGTFMGFPTCGASNLNWAIPWFFTVGAGAPTPFPGGFVANQHVDSTFFCNATVGKHNSGNFCRRIDGSVC